MAQIQNFPFYKGEAIALDFAEANYDEDPAVPTNIAGWTIVMTIVLTPTSKLTKNATITSAPNGQYGFTLTHAETVAMSVGDHSYDVWRTDAGSEAVLAIGVIRLRNEVLY